MQSEDESGFINPMSPASNVISDLIQFWEDTIRVVECPNMPPELCTGGPRPKTAEEIAAEEEKERLKLEAKRRKEAALAVLFLFRD